MKLSPDTISILKYFATIMPSIVISAGSNISTMTMSKNVIASAPVIEDFPQEFGIYNLPEFLNVVSLFKDPELVFLGGKQAQIKEGKTVVNYTFAEPALMTKAPRSLTDLPEVASFELRSEHLTNLQKAMNILNLQDVIIEGDAGTLYLRGTDLKSNSSSSFNYEIGESEKDFKAIIKADFLKLMPGTHNVVVSNKNARFTNVERNVVTWIGVDDKSKF